MKIIVTTDSTADLPKTILEEKNIGVIPLMVNLGDDEYVDGENISLNDLFAFVDKTGTLPKTAARSNFVYKEFFENQLKKYKADAIIHFSISNELSSSYQNAKSASDELKNIYIIDSRSLSSGIGLLALSCCDKIHAGKDIDTILKEINEEIPNIQASFILSNLKYLYKGGRCSAIAAFGANLLQIKPKIKLSEGKMGVDKKYMGKFDNVILKYVDDLIVAHKNFDTARAFITYTSEYPELNTKIVDKLKACGFQNVITNFAGSTIGSHCGKDCLGVLFICK